MPMRAFMFAPTLWETPQYKLELCTIQAGQMCLIYMQFNTSHSLHCYLLGSSDSLNTIARPQVEILLHRALEESFQNLNLISPALKFSNGFLLMKT